jgi:hypothetical protein
MNTQWKVQKAKALAFAHFLFLFSIQEGMSKNTRVGKAACKEQVT